MKKIILTSLILFSFNSFSGNEGGNGGDTYGNEFEALGKELQKTLRGYPSHPGYEKWSFSPQLFTDAITMTIIRSAEGEDVKLDNEEVDAINKLNGDDIIKLNRTRWRSFTLFKKLKIVLHEYFGILDIEKNVYTASDEFIDIVRATHRRIREKYYDDDIDLSYGYQRVTPPINKSTICDPSSAIFENASKAAINEALGQCLLENENCEIRRIENNPIISTTMIGLKYCEITAIAQRIPKRD